MKVPREFESHTLRQIAELVRTLTARHVFLRDAGHAQGCRGVRVRDLVKHLGDLRLTLERQFAMQDRHGGGLNVRVAKRQLAIRWEQGSNRWWNRLHVVAHQPHDCFLVVRCLKQIAPFLESMHRAILPDPYHGTGLRASVSRILPGHQCAPTFRTLVRRVKVKRMASTSMRAVAFSCAVALPVVLGLGLLVFFIDGHLGGATTLLAGFAIAAISFTAIMFRERPETDAADVVPVSFDGRIDRERVAPGGEP
jgi:hypothetical protein